MTRIRGIPTTSRNADANLLDQFVPVRESRVSFWRRDWFWALLLSALVFIAYAQVFRAGFIWDDESHLTRNPCVIGPLGFKEIWTSTQAVYYPLVLTTFWALHKFVGLNPLSYHALNVLLHAASAILLWRVLKLLQVRGAWLGAALWALHPVMVQSVAWVTELKNTQSCLFYLLSIFFFLKWEDQGEAVAGTAPATDRRSPLLGCFALSLLFFLLATLSKPSVVMLPFVLALCIWWMREKIRWRDPLAIAPFAVISALASAWTIWEQKFHARAVGPDWAQTLPERFIIAGRAIWFYFGKLIWPHPLIFIYPRWEVDPSKFIAYVPLLAAIAGLVVLWFIHSGWSRALFFAAAYYVVSLFPVLGFFSVYFFRYSFVSDHFQYLASMGPLALAGARLPLSQAFGSNASRWGLEQTLHGYQKTGALLLTKIFATRLPRRHASCFARFSNVAADCGISRSQCVVHNNVKRKSGLLDGSLQSRHRSQRAGRS